MLGNKEYVVEVPGLWTGHLCTNTGEPHRRLQRVHVPELSRDGGGQDGAMQPLLCGLSFRGPSRVHDLTLRKASCAPKAVPASAFSPTGYISTSVTPSLPNLLSLEDPWPRRDQNKHSWLHFSLGLSYSQM